MSRPVNSNGYSKDPLFNRLREVLLYRLLVPWYQTIADLRDGTLFGYCSQVRGPSDGPLHAPGNLLHAARHYGLLGDLIRMTQQVAIEHFVVHNLPGRLLLPVGLEFNKFYKHDSDNLPGYLHSVGLASERLVIVVRDRHLDGSTTRDDLLATLHHYRRLGFALCLDGIGSGCDMEAVWDVVQPEFGRLDPDFINGMDKDPTKLQHVLGLIERIHADGSQTIADGVHNRAIFDILHREGVHLIKGPLAGGMSPTPLANLPPELLALTDGQTRKAIQSTPRPALCAGDLLEPLEPLTRNHTVDEAYGWFSDHPHRVAVPVVENEVPIGLLNRYTIIDRYARPFRRELFSHRPCTLFMDTAPLIVDRSMELEELSRLVSDAEQRYLSDGFIITDRGRYLGIGTGHTLMREITRLKVEAASYANPLTGLPGNVPINERIDTLIANGIEFVCAYCDLDHFKPFNDVYGYSTGDAIIRTTARVLQEGVDAEHDFVGHVGGDDFIVLLRSPQWEQRCHEMLKRLEDEFAGFFSQEDNARGGYHAEDRQGQRVFHPLPALSIGAITIEPPYYHSHREVAAACADAKKQAKRMPGNSLFIDRRRRAQRYVPLPESPPPAPGD